ncbi:MBL fold metallo-hydrolase [Rhodobacteraceae bacterium 2CG4]|uniref:MBL fold metallo-hydrolase n=1 Tax=Halovulum marinum TaxID=2662447 RepID=A0A6L5Z7S7_9RHOB|nr:MBL fold metallo-hydrolase [Halovulum marinum]MSU92075.1 MBL fold metallo-hydrolase [Halovulum marinum]
MPDFQILMQGFPGRTPRGFLGWSTVVLLHGPDGPVLFDTGAHGDRPGLMAALAARGLRPGDITTVILSHLHFDHIANVECFPQARIVMHESEAASIEQSGADDPAVSLSVAKAVLASDTLQLVSDEPELWPGLQMIRTPGHCLGHVSLVMKQDDGCAVLAQDAVKHRGELGSGHADGAFHPAMAAKSISRIAAMADLIVPGHDAPLAWDGREVTPLASVSTEVSLTVSDRRIELHV